MNVLSNTDLNKIFDSISATRIVNSYGDILARSITAIEKPTDFYHMSWITRCFWLDFKFNTVHSIELQDLHHISCGHL